MNLDHYKHSKKDLIELVLKQNNRNILQAISLVSVCTHVPVVVVLFFVGEELNWPEDILKNIELIKKFYSYKNIGGIPESFPGSKE